MKQLLLSTAYLPSVEYFAFLLTGEALIDGEERYQKQSYRNRAVILNGNGVLNLIIPTIHDNRMGVVKEVRIEYVTPWQRAHWRSIESAYNNTPFYLYYKDALKPFFEQKFDFLFDFNTQLTLTLLKILQARKPDYRYRLTSPYYQVFEDKFGFQPNLSIIDLLFNEGPQAASYLHHLANTFETR